jgi:hypothetical protein
MWDPCGRVPAVDRQEHAPRAEADRAVVAHVAALGRLAQALDGQTALPQGRAQLGHALQVGGDPLLVQPARRRFLDLLADRRAGAGRGQGQNEDPESLHAPRKRRPRRRSWAPSAGEILRDACPPAHGSGHQRCVLLLDRKNRRNLVMFSITRLSILLTILSVTLAAAPAHAQQWNRRISDVRIVHPRGRLRARTGSRAAIEIGADNTSPAALDLSMEVSIDLNGIPIYAEHVDASMMPRGLPVRRSCTTNNCLGGVIRGFQLGGQCGIRNFMCACWCYIEVVGRTPTSTRRTSSRSR